MRKLSKSSIDYYILPNKILCSSIGIWPFDEELSTWKIVFARFRLIFFMVAICTMLIPHIMLITVTWGDVDVLTRTGNIMITLAQILFKTFYLLVKRENTYRLYNELRSLWNSSDDPIEKESYKMFAHWARVSCIIFFSSVISTTIIYTSAALFDCIRSYKMDNNSGSNRHLPFEVWYGMDVSKSPYFEIAFVSQMISALFCTTAISGIVTTCGMVILHVSGQFRLISIWIVGIGFEINNQQTDYLCRCPPKLVTSLNKCVRHHQRLIIVVKEVNDLLTPIIFLQLLTGGVEICLSGFALLNDGSKSDQLKSVAYLTSMMVQLLLWCGPAELLIQESQRVGYSVYLNLPWYKLPPKYRKQVLLIILRSQRCCGISTLMFETLSLHALTTVFNTAASYFALLRQAQEKLLSQQ